MVNDDNIPVDQEEIEEKNDTSQLEEKLAESEEKWKRALADYQNLQRRTEEEKLAIVAFANKNLLLQLLNVLDTLEATTQHLQDKALDLTVKQFYDVLKGQSVEPINTTGEVFNPEVMECVDTNTGEEGKVLSELKKGYTMHGKVLRPALVVVGSGKEEKKKEEKSA